MTEFYKNVYFDFVWLNYIVMFTLYLTQYLWGYSFTCICRTDKSARPRSRPEDGDCWQIVITISVSLLVIMKPQASPATHAVGGWCVVLVLSQSISSMLSSQASSLRRHCDVTTLRGSARTFLLLLVKQSEKYFWMNFLCDDSPANLDIEFYVYNFLLCWM